MADDDLICPPPIPAYDHPARRLAYVRFTLSYRDVEDLLAERGLDVSYETGAAIGFEIRAVVRPRASPSTPTANGAVASRRDGRDDCGQAVLAVARGR